MGRWQSIGLTEGLWREVAAPPQLAFSERSPSPWLRHREDRQWPLPTLKSRHPTLPTKKSRTNARRSEAHTSEIHTLMRIFYAVICLTKISEALRHSIGTGRIRSDQQQ